MKAISVSARELKKRLSLYLRRVKAGESVVITEHGRPVGRIISIQADLQSRLKVLVEAGVVEWNGQPVPHYRPQAVNRSKRLLSDLISENRR